MAKMEAGTGRRLVFGEDGEEAGPTAGERGVEGAVGVEGRFYSGELGMQLENRLLEIIDDLVAPLGNRSGDDAGERGGVFGGGAKREGFGGADVDAGVDERYGVCAKIEGYRREPFAAASAETRGIEDKEGAVAAELCGILQQLFLAETEMELRVECFEGPGPVSRTAAEAGADGDVLQQVDVDRG